MKINRAARWLALTAVLFAGVAGSSAAAAAPKGDTGHTPVTLCHWVPAHGGSYIVITVDDDGSSGNKNLRGHAHHENDIIPVGDDGVCDAGGDDGGGGED